MLKDIRFHLADAEDDQKEMEQALSRHIITNHRRSVLAFSHHVPSLASQVKDVATSNIALFANKFGKFNIVNYTSGRTLYGLDPKNEVQEQYRLFSQHASYLSFSDVTVQDEAYDQENIRDIANVSELPYFRRQKKYTTLPESVNALVVMGLGLGYHIEELINNHTIRHLVIYEPELQYFQCSVLALDWQRLLQTMASKGTAVYLLIGNDGSGIVDNISELRQAYDIEGFYFYKHYNNDVFDNIDVGLKLNSWAQYKTRSVARLSQKGVNTFLPTWTDSVDIDTIKSVDKSNELFRRNLSAFQKYFPKIYQEFSEFTPVDWLPIIDNCGEVNVVLKGSLQSFGGRLPKHNAVEHLKFFYQKPQKDSLVLGYKGTKLKHYKHYQFVEETERFLQDISEEVGNLPDHVKSLIMFGVGLGYQIEELYKQKTVDKLFLCEPNKDFFYASLFAIDWHEILTKVDKEKSRIYINIGDDGSNIFNDLLGQFYSVGPYILASTYFYQSYYNAHLVRALARLREQLQIVISMGEYFDHAFYGISHTVEAINRGYPLLAVNAERKLNASQRETPVFLVGNGPSLDSCIEAIKELREKAIIVSCGTALMPLYKNGIVPDFHAEIEQNRSTFDWVSRIGDFDYLKQISLISCNGIHPDTCNLFKDVFIAFKTGESSTVSSVNLIGLKKFEELDFAFPTVSNFALNLFTTMGFNQIYLFGIDLGFTDRKKHHSSQSGYYSNDGEEIYDYSKKNDTSFVIEGNFQKTVFTKYEFKVSKDILERALAKKPVYCFNCSNGAKINGALPLLVDDVLLVNSEESVASVVDIVKQNIFESIPEYGSYTTRFKEKYRQDVLHEELESLLTLAREPVHSLVDINALIERQKDLLFDSYRKGSSLLFYLLFGSMNYCNVMLSKCEYIKSEASALSYANKLLQRWTDFLAEARDEVTHIESNFDISESFGSIRQIAHLKRHKAHILCITNINQSHMFNQFNERLFSPNVVEIKQCGPGLTESSQLKSSVDIRFALWVQKQSQVDAFIHTLNTMEVPNAEVIWFGTHVTSLDMTQLNMPMSKVVHPDFVYGNAGLENIIKGASPYWVEERMPFVALKHNFGSVFNKVLVPKIKVKRSECFDDILQDLFNAVVKSTFEYEYYLDFGEFVVFANLNDLRLNAVDMCGNRGILCKKDLLKPQALLDEEICDDVEHSIVLTFSAGKAGGRYQMQ